MLGAATGLGIAGLFLGIIAFVSIALFVLNIITSIWAYRDAQRKGKSKEYAIVVLILTIIFPFIGLIVYYFIRND
ncbi:MULTISPECIES: PLDc N-terminal domain-containing protein [Pontibacillus]|uniref:PLDc N-terminal domain-containing protein n=1 Tax=Pontibacillus chungwhensis TaxID=265426 RepID=A0ABY8V2R7_9BACI|nr:MULTISPECIES: PLDc N-terminal domain-containing protein [Pontibacillus]MCD5322488.1 PLDc N-terminal domain-containing protein [Pontibacillus sp. HN14]WIF99773.1 PLDc N-terminal domain-containing protein [Pontibacillus chungwhensis]